VGHGEPVGLLAAAEESVDPDPGPLVAAPLPALVSLAVDGLLLELADAEPLLALEVPLESVAAA
jgi:hypothetical protein